MSSYTVVEWQEAPELDLTLVRVEDGAPGEPERAEIEALLEEDNLVCFRCADLAETLRRSPAAAAAMEEALDATLLARIVYPTADSHDLAGLAERLGIPTEWPSASARARAAAAAWAAIIEELRRMPLAVLVEMERLLEPTQHPFYPLLAEEVVQAVRTGFGTRERTLRDILNAGEAVPWRVTREPPVEPPAPLEIERVCDFFNPGGALSERFGAYEYRAEQVRMAREVAESFNDDLVTLVEAGTGTGKSMAYLVPSILWARDNRDPVVISTNTKNLQSQLFTRDLPVLEEAIGAFRYALIKGRANYLCVRKFLMTLGDADRELTAAERVEVLPVVTWAAATKTGDVAENAGMRGGMGSELWGRLSTQPDECLGARCRFSRVCFVRKARSLAMQADVVVANHATLFVESGETSVALPPYRRVIFDEAHNLEDVATDAFTVAVAPWTVPRALNRLFRAQRDGAGRGLFASLRAELSRAKGLDAALRTRLSELIQTATESFREIRARSDALFNAVAFLFSKYGREEKVRYSAERLPRNWPAVAEAIGELKGALAGLAAQLETIHDEISDLLETTDGDGKKTLALLGDVGTEIGFLGGNLLQIIQSLDTLLKAEDETYVYWAQQGGREETALCAAPLDIAELMNQTVFSRTATAIFTSATLTAAGTFDFMRDRLGIRGAVSSRVREVDLGTSFDFPNQVLLAVPTFLPEPRPGGPDVIAPFSRLTIEALRASRGRALVLFTSHAALRESYAIIRPALAAEGIRVMAQGIDGERARLVALFAKETSSVLMGTQSFWEGVDVPGESLSCLVVAKLPFRAHTDPLVAARCELLKAKGHNEFFDYMVPDAVIRLKQGFGRLIRTRDDRGVVLLCDPRVMTKGYGRAFRESLPVRARVFASEQKLIEAVAAFLK